MPGWKTVEAQRAWWTSNPGKSSEYSRRYRLAHLEEVQERERKYREKNKEKNRAYMKVKRALKSGKLVRPDCCSQCGTKGEVHGHHEDYSKPLDVVWLCKKCHCNLP